MKLKIKNISLLLVILLVFSYSCDDFINMDLQNNPNNVTESDADVNFLLNGMQKRFVDFVAGRPAENTMGLNSSALEHTRMINQFGQYSSAFSRMSATSHNQLWEWSYMRVLKNSQLLLQLAEEGGFTYHAGMGKMIKALTLVNLVDFFGDVPYDEALLGAENFNPGLTAAEDIYDIAFGLIDSAIADFSGPVPGGLPNDYFYNNNASKWIKMANTLKLKMYLQTRLVSSSESKAGINAIISSGNYISSPDDDFYFQYSTIDSDPDSRQPEYVQNYLAAGGQDYMSNYYMDLLINHKSVRDPRLRYYIYRQTDEDPTGDDLPCAGLGYDFCYLGYGYWGRDHADREGVPNDALKRSVTGVYPAGGAFDGDTFLSVTDSPGAAGAGIFPIFMSSYVKFMLAESALTLQTNGDAKAYYEAGVRESISTVMAFGSEQAGSSEFIPDNDHVEQYVSDALDRYDASLTDAEIDVLDVVITEYYLALYGNAIEAYNTIRRTGFPSTLQAPVVSAGGSYPNSYFYPASLVDRNSSVDQKQLSDRVFWDTNTTDLP